MKGSSPQKAKEAPMIGKAGEHLVAFELLSRFINVSWPSVDEGADLVARNGCRIQVKTARVRLIPAWSKEPVYSFHFKQRKFMAYSSGKIVERAKKKLSEICDVVVLVGLEQKRCWIVPAALLDEVHCAYMGPATVRSFEKDIPEMQEMVSLGFSQKEIGQYYGINQASVYERLQNAGKPKADKKYVGTLRSCENMWHHIIDFNSPALQAPVIIPEISTQDLEA